MLSTHPVFLSFIHSGTAATLAFLFLAIALWATIRHTRNGVAPVSFSLLLAGIALGLCLLSGGPIAIVGFVLLLVFLFDKTEEPVRSSFDGLRRRVSSERVHRLLAPVVLALTAFSVGGWWVMMMASRFGREFWSEWFRLSSGEFLSRTPGDWNVVPEASEMRLLLLLGGYAVPAIFGWGRAVFALYREDDRQRRQRLIFLVCWSLLGGGCWLLNSSLSGGEWGGATIWDGLLLVPLLICAAFTFEEILQRRISLAITVVLTCAAMAMFATMTFPGDAPGFENGRAVVPWGICLATFCSVVFGFAVYFTAGRLESRIRPAIGVLTVGVVVSGAVWGLTSVGGLTSTGVETTDDERALTAFTTQLKKLAEVDEILLISADRPPVVLEFRLRSMWPDAEFTVIKVENGVVDSPAGLAAGSGKTIIVEWTGSRDQSSVATINRIDPVLLGPPQFYRRKDLSAYQIRILPPPN